MHSSNYDVIIVGGGPVGLGLALELGQRHVRCALVERHLEPQQIPKGQNLTQRTMEHFRAWGVEEAVREARLMRPGVAIGGLTAYGSLLGPYWHSWYHRSQVGQYYHTANERLPQYRTEAVLRAAVAELAGVDTFIGWTAEDLVRDDEAVEVIMRPTTGGDERRLAAAYAVGCDGSRSMVRRRAGIHEELADHDRTMALLVFRSTELHRLLARHRDSSFFKVLHPRFDGYWQFLGRVDAEERWFFHAPMADAGGGERDVVQMVYDAVGTEFAIELDHVGAWELRTASATTFRRGRVFVAGDAAHSHPPYGGFGINLGFEDARNLGWKLAGVLGGWGGDGLLASYDSERRPVFTSTAAEFIEGAIDRDRTFVRGFDPERDVAAFEAEWEQQAAGANSGVRAFEPHYEGSPVVAGAGGSPGAVGTHTFEARPGHHLPPSGLSTGEAIGAVLGSGFTLLAFDAAPSEVEPFRRSAREHRVPLEIVVDSLAGERARYGARLVLVRPDHFVAWVGDTPPPDVDALLRRVTGNR